MGREGHQKLWEEPQRRGRASLGRVVQESSALTVVLLLIELYLRTACKCLS